MVLKPQGSTMTQIYYQLSSFRFSDHASAMGDTCVLVSQHGFQVHANQVSKKENVRTHHTLILIAHWLPSFGTLWAQYIARKKSATTVATNATMGPGTCKFISLTLFKLSWQEKIIESLANNWPLQRNLYMFQISSNDVCIFIWLRTHRPNLFRHIWPDAV